MSKVTKDMVDAVRIARWEEWERMAKDMPRGHHILSAELLRINRDETAVVITAVQDQRLVQYELRGNAMGGDVRPVVSQHRAAASDQSSRATPHAAALAMLAATGDDGGPIANTVAMGEPPVKEPPHPGAIALGGSLLTTTFRLDAQALDPIASSAG